MAKKDEIRDTELARLTLEGTPAEAERAVAKHMKKVYSGEPNRAEIRKMIREARKNAGK